MLLLLKNQVGGNEQFKLIQPDSLVLRMDSLVMNSLAVLTEGKITIPPNFGFTDDIRSNPDTIEARGPKATLGSLKSVYIQPLELDGRKDSKTAVTQRLQLPELFSVSFSDSVVSVSATIEEFTESSLKVPVQIVDLPKGVMVEVFPESVSVIFNVPLSRYHEIDPSNFSVLADFNNQTVSSNRKIRLELKYWPGEVQQARLQNEFADYIIFEKK